MRVFRLCGRAGILVLGTALGVAAAAADGRASDGRNSAREPVRPARPRSLPVNQPLPTSRSAQSGRPETGAPAKPAAPAEWKDIEKAVSDHFAAVKDYEPDDLLARGDVEPVQRLLKDRGWQPDDWKEIADDVLPDNDELVRALRTPRGRAFMRKIAGHPGGYDRLDKLRALPQGSRQMRELIEAPDGYKLIEYMTTTEGGKTLGRQLSRTPQGRNFNEPTGRIYTEGDLLRRLEASFRKARGEELRPAPPARGSDRGRIAG